MRRKINALVEDPAPHLIGEPARELNRQGTLSNGGDHFLKTKICIDIVPAPQSIQSCCSKYDCTILPISLFLDSSVDIPPNAANI